MAQVTMELRTVLQMTNFTLFDFDYEIDDLAWKAKLEQDFIDEFYFMEIGQETIDRWKHRVMTKFKKIMPYYNEIHKVHMLDINPLITHSRSETYNATNGNTSSSTAVNDTIEYLDPQTGTSTDIPASRLNNDGTSGSSSSGTSSYTKNIEGLDGNQAEMIKKYEDSVIRINEMILRECKDLFILVY